MSKPDLRVYFCLLLLTGFIIVPFTGWPEMTFWPYLVLKGWHPYTDFAMVHTPLLIWSLALCFKITGVSLVSLKIFTWLTILIAALCLTLAAKYLKIDFLWSVLIFLLLLLTFDANGIWFDLALVPLALLIFLFIHKRYFIAVGVFLAVAIATKQTAVYWLVPAAFQLFITAQLKFKNLVKIFSGFILASIIVLLPFAAKTDFQNAKYWVFDFGVLTLPKILGDANNVSPFRILFFTLPYIFALVLVFIKKPTLAVWGLFAALGAFPRWELFHFLPGLSFVSLGLVSFAGKKIGLMLLILFICGLMLIASAKSKIGQPDRFWDKGTVGAAARVKALTSAVDCIYILNYWDNIYQMADRLPCIRPWYPFLPQYLNSDGIKNKMTADLITNQPVIIIRYPYTVSGLGSIRLQELDSFIDRSYKIIDNYGNIRVLQKI